MKTIIVAAATAAMLLGASNPALAAGAKDKDAAQAQSGGQSNQDAGRQKPPREGGKGGQGGGERQKPNREPGAGGQNPDQGLGRGQGQGPNGGQNPGQDSGRLRGNGMPEQFGKGGAGGGGDDRGRLERRDNGERDNGDRDRGDRDPRDRFDNRGDPRGDNDRERDRRPDAGRGDNDRRGNQDARRPGEGRQLRARDNNRRWHNPRDWRPSYRSPRRFKVGIYIRPRGWYARTWRYGEYLPYGWYGANYYLNAYSYGLPMASIGTEWVRVGDDAYLVDIWTGRILTIYYDVFW
jgi:Ni/Co efflux regulator RcnB